MNIADLGVLDGQILLFGGCYSNQQATQAVLDWADQKGIPRDHRIMTGDAVAYCAQPNETLSQLQTRGGPVIAGNCEIQLASGALDCGCGFDQGSACDILSVGWFEYVSRSLQQGFVPWMQNLPNWGVFTHHNQRFVVIHGGADNVARFIWPDDDLSIFQKQIQIIENQIGAIDGVIAGHSGIAFQRQIGAVTWINAGVIGMPPNRGQQTTEFASLAKGRVTFHSLSYDYLGAVRAMKEAGLTQGYDRALVTGIWPSQDILPAHLRLVDNG